MLRWEGMKDWIEDRGQVFRNQKMCPSQRRKKYPGKTAISFVCQIWRAHLSREARKGEKWRILSSKSLNICSFEDNSSGLCVLYGSVWMRYGDTACMLRSIKGVLRKWRGRSLKPGEILEPGKMGKWETVTTISSIGRDCNDTVLLIERKTLRSIDLIFIDNLSSPIPPTLLIRHNVTWRFE